MPVLSQQEGGPSGPGIGRGSNGQYAYWIVMVQPTPAVVASHGLKKPEEFTREEFGKLMVKVHRECGTKIVEIHVYICIHTAR